MAGQLEGVPIQIIDIPKEMKQKTCAHRVDNLCQQQYCPRYLNYCVTPAHCKFRGLPRGADPDGVGAGKLKLKPRTTILVLKPTERLKIDKETNIVHCPQCGCSLSVADFVFPVLDKNNVYMGVSSIGAFYCSECRIHITTQQALVGLNEKLNGKKVQIKQVNVEKR